jgi:hypothetical protein
VTGIVTSHACRKDASSSEVIHLFSIHPNKEKKNLKLIWLHSRSLSQLYWSWSLLFWSVIGIESSHACMEGEFMPLFSIRHKQREEKAKYLVACIVTG